MKLSQFREITKALPGDYELKVLSGFTPTDSFISPSKDITYSKKDRNIIIVPTAAFIDDGTDRLTVSLQNRKNIVKQTNKEAPPDAGSETASRQQAGQ
jgi:hypothetical protein